MKILKNQTARRELIAFTGFFYLIPTLALYFGFLPFWTRHVVLTLMGLILVAYAIGKPIKSYDLGFRSNNFRKAMIWNGMAVAFVLSLVYIFWKAGILKSSYLGGETFLFYIFYVFVSAPIQEFVFRSLMFYELNLLVERGMWFKIIFSAFIFSIAHIMYHDPVVILVTFLMGVLWGYIYIKNPNFWGIAISHAIIGAVTVFFGIV